ncbi:15479_t:CDS:2, partial [Cetraspora pellucida]
KNDTPIKSNREAVNGLWKQGERSPQKISQKTDVPHCSCERYITQLRKNGQIPEIHCPAAEIKARLEKTHLGLEVGKQTIHDYLQRYYYVARLSKRIPLLIARDIIGFT